jgi:hypothetical protein
MKPLSRWRASAAAIVAVLIATLFFAASVRPASSDDFDVSRELPSVGPSMALARATYVHAYSITGVRMSAVTGGGLGAGASVGTPGGLAPPATYVSLKVYGQSTSIGQVEGNLPDGSVQGWLGTSYINNAVQAWTSICPSTMTDGGWPPPLPFGYIPNYTDCGIPMKDASDPSWILMGLREPVNNLTPQTSVSLWPLNDYGYETPGVAYTQQAYAGARALGFTDYRVIWDSEGVSGNPISAIGVGTSAWNQWMVTTTAEHRLATADGGTHIVGGVFVRWGQSDCANWGYGTTFQSFVTSTTTAFKAITGQTRAIPFLTEQVQNWCGSGFRIVSTIQLAIAQAAAPGTIQSIGPEYYSEPTSLHLEHNDTWGNAQQGELAGDVQAMDEAYFLGQHEWFLPLAPKKIGQVHGVNNSIGTQDLPDPGTFVRVGNTVTIHMHVPAGETMVADTSLFPSLHTFGPWAPFWSTALGHEAWLGCTYADGGGTSIPAPPGTTGITGTPCTPVAITSATIGGTPSDQTVTLVMASNFDTLAYAQTPDGNLYLDGGVFDGGLPATATTYGQAAVGWGPPLGAAGQVRTDYSKAADRTHRPIQHWEESWVQGGFSIAGGLRGADVLAALGLVVLGAGMLRRRGANDNGARVVGDDARAA